MLFQSTVESLLQITGPWDRFLETSLISKKLEERWDSMIPRSLTASTTTTTCD